MRSVDLDSVVSAFAKRAKIDLSPKQLFAYIELPESIRKELEEVGKKVLPADVIARDVDHVTLLYIPKSEEDVPPEKLERLLKELREVTMHTKPITAKVQGWAYFDGAESDGVSQTALVALIDAPGLEDLHVELKSACRRAGFEPSDRHVYNPHATIAYLPKGERVKDLPLLNGTFEIGKAMFVNNDKHELPFKSNVGEKAAAAATRIDHIPGGKADKLDFSDVPPKALARGLKVEREHTSSDAFAKEIALDHLSEDPKYYAKLEKAMPGEVSKSATALGAKAAAAAVRR